MPTVNIPDQFSVSAYGKTLSAGQITDANVMQLIELGFTGGMRAAGSISKEAKAKAGNKDAIVALQVANREKRYPLLVSGEKITRLGSGAGASSPLAKQMRAIARERLKALCQNQGIAMLKGEELKKAIEAITKAQHDDIQNEANARMASSKASAEALKAAGIFA